MKKVNQKMWENIVKGVDGDIGAIFEIVIEFNNLIKKESKINGKYSKECEDYIVDQIIKYVPRFNKINKFKNF